MRRILLPLTAFAVMLPAPFVVVTAPASAHVSKKGSHYHYKGKTYFRHAKRCRHSRGDAGLIAGGVGGAVVGSEVIGGGLVGIAAGAVGGALAGRAIDRGITARRRCR